MDELIAQLLTLAVAWSGYPAPATVPAVHIVSAARIPCRCPGFFGYTARIHGYGAAPEFSGELLLRDDVDLHGTYGRSILLHELVHALQAQEGCGGVRLAAVVPARARGVPCPVSVPARRRVRAAQAGSFAGED